jgi:hypothetical protein
MRRRVAADEAAREVKPTVGAEAVPPPPPVPPAPPLAPEPGRFSLLKKPLTDKPDPYAALRSPAAAQGNR